MPLLQVRNQENKTSLTEGLYDHHLSLKKNTKHFNITEILYTEQACEI